MNRNTPLHTCIKLAPLAAKYVPILIEHGSNPNLQERAASRVVAARRCQAGEMGCVVDGVGGRWSVWSRPRPWHPPHGCLLGLLSRRACCARVQNALGQTVLHVLAERAVREMQQLMALGVEAGTDPASDPAAATIAHR